MRRICVLSGLVLAGGLLSPGTALAAEDDQHRWIAEQDEFAIVLPNGDTFTDEDPPPDEEGEPPVGARLFIGEVLYETDDGETKGDEIGRTHITCTVQAVTTAFLCDIAFVVEDKGQLHGTVLVEFSEDETEQLQFDIAVTGGTDDFSGAAGEVSLTDITDTDDPDAVTMTLYETDINVDGD